MKSCLHFSLTSTRGLLAALALIAVAAGPIRADQLRAWGNNDFGIVTHAPVGGDFVDIAAGAFVAAGVRTDGRLAAWGSDLVIWGSLVSAAPTDANYVKAAVGETHAIAIRRDGSLMAWGNDSGGKVSNTPAGNNFVAVGAGQAHSVALRSDGTLVSWLRCRIGPRTSRRKRT